MDAEMVCERIEGGYGVNGKRHDGRMCVNVQYR
jgi:hypothetical protein